MVAKSKDKESKNQEIQAKCLAFIRAVESVDENTQEGTSLKHQRILWNRGFYNGAHWTREEYNRYASQGIEPIKINRCRAIVKAICGMERQNSSMIVVEPRKSGNQSVADVLTELVRHTQDMSTPDGEGAEYLYSECFQAGLIDREAFLKAERDRVHTPGGQLRFKVKSSYDVDIDPNCKEYNPNESARFIIERDWRDKDEIDIRYKDRLNQEAGTLSDDDTNGLYDYFYGDMEATYDEVRKKYRYQIREIWWKEKVEGLLVIDKTTNDHKITTDAKQIKKLSDRAKKQRKYYAETITVDKLHQSILLGRILLEDIEDPLEGITGFPYFPFRPYFHQGDYAGLLDDIIDLNRQENISRTQILRNLTQTMNTGWIVGGGTTQDQNKLADYGSVDGLVIDKSKYGNFVDKIEGNKIPEGHFMNAEQMERDVKIVSGVDDAFMGYETGGGKESGRAIALKQQQAQIIGNDILRNFHRTLHSFGNYVVQLLLTLKIYTPDEVRAIVSESTLIDSKKKDEAYQELVGRLGAGLPAPTMPQPPDPTMLQMIRPEDQDRVYRTIQAGVQGAQMYAEQYPLLVQRMDEVVKEYAIQKMIDELDKPDLGQYGIRVTISPTAPTTQMANLIELMAIQDRYGIIPPDKVIEATSLSNKDEIIDSVKQMMNQPPPQPPMQPPGQTAGKRVAPAA